MQNSELSAAILTLARGGIVAYPAEGVWGLGCDPFNYTAVEKILRLKGRPADKGLILAAASVKQFSPLLEKLDTAHRETLLSACPGPDTWLIPDPDHLIPDWIRGASDKVAIRVSKHPLVKKLSAGFGSLIVSTSANPAGEAPALSRAQVEKYFPDKIDCIVPGELGGQDGPSTIRDLLSGDIIRP